MLFRVSIALAVGSGTVGCEPEGNGRDARWRSGSLRYEARVDSTVALSGRAESNDFYLAGPLRIDVRVSGGVHQILVDPEFQLVHRSSTANDGREVEGVLSEPFVAEIERGTLVRYRFRPGLPPEVEAVRRFLGSLVQHPAEGRREPGKPWSSEEWDGTGRYAVDYEFTGEGTLRWKHRGYRHLLYGVGEKHRDVPVERMSLEAEGHGTSRWDARGLVELERSAAIVAPLPQGARLRSGFRAKLGPREILPPVGEEAWAEALRGTEPVAVDTPPASPQTSLANSLRARGRNLDEVLSLLESLEAAGEGTNFREVAETRGALVALLSEEPLLAHQVEGKLALGKLDAPLIEALSAASTEASLSVLSRAALNERFDKGKRERAARAFIQAPRPPKEAFPLLLRLRERPEFEEHGLLGLGTFVRRYREAKATVEVERGVELLRSALRGARSDEAREVALLAVANSGEASLFPEVEPFFASTSPRLRPAALQAIRLMDDARVEPVLVGALGEREGRVVAAALRALGRRDEVSLEGLAAVRRVAVEHKGADVRLEAVQALARWAHSRPDLVPFLRDVAMKDSDPRVREAAAKGAS